MIISACGNNCTLCPRFMPKSDSELINTAKLWYKIGYRDKIVSNEEIACYGCTSDNFCRYSIVQCTQEHNLENCGQCENYPCERITEAFDKTILFKPMCKEQCTKQEYEMMREAFFCKKDNLDRERNKLTR